MKLIILTLMSIVVVLMVSGFSTVEITAPTPLTYQSSTAVNISAGMNISAFSYLRSYNLNESNATINVTIYTKATSSGTYSILASSLILTYQASNSSITRDFWNYTATLSEGRNYVKVGFENVSRAADGSFNGVNTSERIVQIDSAPNLINFSSNLHLENYNLSINSPGGERWDCGPNDSGTWSCS